MGVAARAGVAVVAKATATVIVVIKLVIESLQVSRLVG